MRRKITVITMIIIFTIMPLIFSSCARQSEHDLEHGELQDIIARADNDVGKATLYLAETTNNHNVINEGQQSLTWSPSPPRVGNIEQLEDILVLSRVADVLGFGFGDDDEDPSIDALMAFYNIPSFPSNVFSANVSSTESYYVPSENSFEGFEIVSISIGSNSIHYRYLPIGMSVSDLASLSNSIRVTLDKPHPDVPDLLEAIIAQTGIPINDDGLIYNPRLNTIHARVGNIRMSLTVPDHMNNYEFLRDIALTEFTSDNIRSVDDMIGERLASRAEDAVIIRQLLESEGIGIEVLTSTEKFVERAEARQLARQAAIEEYQSRMANESQAVVEEYR